MTQQTFSDNNNDWNKLLESESEKELQAALMNSVKSNIETQEDEILQRVLRESLLSLDNITHDNTHLLLTMKMKMKMKMKVK